MPKNKTTKKVKLESLRCFKVTKKEKKKTENKTKYLLKNRKLCTSQINKD